MEGMYGLPSIINVWIKVCKPRIGNVCFGQLCLVLNIQDSDNQFTVALNLKKSKKIKEITLLGFCYVT